MVGVRDLNRWPQLPCALYQTELYPDLALWQHYTDWAVKIKGEELFRLTLNDLVN